MNTVWFDAACPSSVRFPFTIPEYGPASVPFAVSSLLPRRSLGVCPSAAGAALPAEWQVLEVYVPGSPEPVSKCGSVRALLQMGQTLKAQLTLQSSRARLRRLGKATPPLQKVKVLRVQGQPCPSFCFSSLPAPLLPCPSRSLMGALS